MNTTLDRNFMILTIVHVVFEKFSRCFQCVLCKNINICHFLLGLTADSLVKKQIMYFTFGAAHGLEKIDLEGGRS